MAPEASGLVQGTLHMLILKTLTLEPLHGYGIGVRLEQISQGGFLVNAGSLFPALRRLERDGLIRGEWPRTTGARSTTTSLRRVARASRARRASGKRSWQPSRESSRQRGRRCD